MRARLFEREQRGERGLILGLGVGMLAHQVFGQTDAFLLGTKPGVVMWMIMGLITGLYLKLAPGTWGDRGLGSKGVERQGSRGARENETGGQGDRESVSLPLNFSVSLSSSGHLQALVLYLT